MFVPKNQKKHITRSKLWAAGFLLVSAGVSPSAQGTQTAAPPASQATAPAAPQPAAPAPPSPVQLANQSERQRIMSLLKISAIPPGAVSSSPATYNEAEATPYPTLPDPLTLKNGQKVTTAAVWRSKRRGELLEDFQREIYGGVHRFAREILPSCGVSGWFDAVDAAGVESALREPHAR